MREKLKVLTNQDPQESGYLATFWTVAMFLIVLAKQVQVSLSTSPCISWNCAGGVPA